MDRKACSAAPSLYLLGKRLCLGKTGGSQFSTAVITVIIAAVYACSNYWGSSALPPPPPPASLLGGGGEGHVNCHPWSTATIIG